MWGFAPVRSFSLLDLILSVLFDFGSLSSSILAEFDSYIVCWI
jgi:hypothetical protein